MNRAIASEHPEKKYIMLCTLLPLLSLLLGLLGGWILKSLLTSPVEKIVEVEKPVEKIVEVPMEVIREIEVIKEVEVPVEVEVIREVEVEVVR